MQFAHQVPHLPRAGHAERVPDGNRAAVDIVFGVIDLQAIACVKALGSKGLIEFPQVDIRHLQTLGLEQLGHREHRADAHLVRLATGHGKATEERLGLEPQFQSFSQAHHQGHRRTVGELRGVTCRHRAILGKHRLQAAEAGQGGVRAVAVVPVYHAIQDLHRASVLVLDLVLDRHRHDFIVEQAISLGLGGALLALQRIKVLVFAADVIAARNDFGGLAHGEVNARHLFLKQRVDQVIGVDALHGQADGLHATGNNDVAAARSDLVGGNGNRLQARRTEAVEGHARRTGAQLREHRHIAPDVIALGAFVGAGTDDAVFHRRRVYTVAGQQRIDTMGRHVIGTGLVELAAKGFGQAGSHAVDDHYFTHGLPRSCGCGSRIDPGLADRDDHSLRGCKSMEPL
ncbi:hypothetical protein SRABI111_05772 [Pseudomonas carnis]|nr:hypothetical protein SRABI111_05772 [Pseudomonas carnis]